MIAEPDAARQYPVFAFMTVVTGLLVAYAFAETARGIAGMSGTLVYGMAAAFGLEFLGSSWASLWKRRSVGRA
jgi:hypothetical protein